MNTFELATLQFRWILLRPKLVYCYRKYNGHKFFCTLRTLSGISILQFVPGDFLNKQSWYSFVNVSLTVSMSKNTHRHLNSCIIVLRYFMIQFLHPLLFFIACYIFYYSQELLYRVPLLTFLQ